jgi:tRNA modification GTPase
MPNADTIAAVATAPGRAGIGIVRVSGPAAGAIALEVTGRKLVPRVAAACKFRDGGGEAIDEGIALYFPAPHSYTGEDVLELQGHGGPVVQQRLMRRCFELGARAAEPGEFTRRAFLNDKIDLVQAEGVADLIEASSELAARSAMRSLAGEFSDRIDNLNANLTELRALVEAALDFPEEDIDVVESAGVKNRLASLQDALAGIAVVAKQGRLLREGMRVVLVGRPNVGKSSLLNRLAGEEVAIVTDVPGTTRDALRHELVIEGIPVHVVDTAGLRESADRVEKIGIERSWHEAGLADIAMLITESGRELSAEDCEILARLPERTNKIFVFNKIDLSGELPDSRRGRDGVEIRVSANTGAGLPLLRQAILESVDWRPAGEAQFLARERHLQALEAARAHTTAAMSSTAPELVAEELRLAQQALSTITGEFSADDLLGEIFSRFCIGK